MRYMKQVGTFLSLGALMLGLAACGGKEKKQEGTAPTPAPAGEAPKK
jgi:ABC-type glycerol-3-phosphate transport system substrate-binding protein